LEKDLVVPPGRGEIPGTQHITNQMVGVPIFTQIGIIPPLGRRSQSSTQG
jgi:hypothetical protein